MTNSNRRCGGSRGSKPDRVPVKRYIHPICQMNTGGCETLEAILAALERQNILLETLCRTLGGHGGKNL